MARSINRLSARTVATIDRPGRHADGAGLYLSIDRSGRRRWVFLSWKGGKQVEVGLGSAKEGSPDFVKLTDARQAAEKIRGRLGDGDDLKSAKSEPAATPTFEAAVEAYITSHGNNWRNDKHREQWRSTMAGHAKSLSKLNVDQIGEDDVLAVLQPIWTTVPETAARVRGRVEAVLDFARARRWRAGDNPARWKGLLEYVLPPRQRLTRGHHAAASYSAVPSLYKRAAALQGVSPQALCFTILTAARSGEVRGALWGEFDLAAALWTIPAARMKAGREHIVPLSEAALNILRSVRPETPEPTELVFKGPRTGKPLSDMSISAVLRRMGIAVTVHGFRSSFRDWAGDVSGIDRDTAEAALAHVVRDATERAYRRSTALEKRRALMKEWADYCLGNP